MPEINSCQSMPPIIGVPILKVNRHTDWVQCHAFAMATLGERLRKARNLRGLSQITLGELSGISQPTISDLETGKTQDATSDTLLKLSNILRIRPQWLGKESGAMEFGGREAARAPKQVIDHAADHVGVRRGSLRLAAGVPGFAIEYENHESPPIFFRRDWFKSRGYDADKLIALKVQGSSMEPGLYEGDTVVVNTADSAPVDGEVYAMNYEGQPIIKRLKRDAGEWWLASDNADKRKFGDKRCSEHIFIIGRIVHRGGERI